MGGNGQFRVLVPTLCRTVMGNTQSLHNGSPSEDFSNKQEKTIMGEIAEEKLIAQGGSHFISVEVIKKVSASVCKVKNSDGTYGTGFLGKFVCNNAMAHGLFTNNHVLTEETLADCDKPVNLDFGDIGKEFKLCLKDTFRFTCPLLDVTFIHINENTVTKLHDLMCEFLSVYFNWEGKEGDQLLVMQNPRYCCGVQVASGPFYRMHGFDILHKTSTDRGSSGSPLMTNDGKVIGVHKCRAKKESDQYNIGVSAKAVLAAIYNFKTLPKKLISNPRNLDMQYEDQIFQQNLIRATTTGPCKYGIIYISPATKVPILGTLITPIWFVPTSHGWYWTPTDPFNKEFDVNWMSVHNLKVVGGKWHDIEPANKNIVIINWLRRNNTIAS